MQALTLLTPALAQTTDDDASGTTAFVAFLVVMGIVVVTLVVLSQRRKRAVGDETTRLELEQRDAEARRISFEEKMRRVEERLRAQGDDDGTGDDEPPGGVSSA